MRHACWPAPGTCCTQPAMTLACSVIQMGEEGSSGSAGLSGLAGGVARKKARTRRRRGTAGHGGTQVYALMKPAAQRLCECGRLAAGPGPPLGAAPLLADAPAQTRERTRQQPGAAGRTIERAGAGGDERRFDATGNDSAAGGGGRCRALIIARPLAPHLCSHSCDAARLIAGLIGRANQDLCLAGHPAGQRAAV